MKKITQQEQYQHLIENVNDAVYTIRLSDGCFTSINPAGERMTGYTKKELLNLRFSDVIAPEHLDTVKKRIVEKAQKHIATIYEIEIVKKDGLRLPVEISSRAAYENDKPVEILGIARDITERKHLEKQKEVFLSLITHELKNPLSVIKMYVDLLQRQKNVLGEKEDQYLSIIQAQIDTLTILMNDFLEISKIRVGKFSTEKKIINLNDVVREIVAMFQRDNTVCQIQIEAAVLKPVLGDKNRLKQVVTNLVTNAIKYAPKAKKIIIKTENNGTDVIVSVQDFGVGIAKQELPKIFELFFRTEHAEKTKIKGHGLGLYICKEIIKNHNGKMWVKSELGKGSTFFFSLPQKKA